MYARIKTSREKPKVRLKRIRISNFKSFKEAELEFNKINILIGPNASGKSNFVDVFRFLKRVFTQRGWPFLPHLPWWSAKNLAYEYNVEEPIKIGLDFECYTGDSEYRVAYDMVFSITGDTLMLSHEKLEVLNYVTILREGGIIKVIHSENALDELKVKEKIKEEIMRGITTSRIARVSIRGIKKDIL